MPRPSAPKITKAYEAGVPSHGELSLRIMASYRQSIHASQGGSSHAHNSPDPLGIHLPRRPQPDLLYMNILQDTVNKSATGPGEAANAAGNDDDNCLHTQIRGWNPLLQLDEVDSEYLTKKGTPSSKRILTTFIPSPQY
ncbi:hypothetical protein FG05_35351 [Fusarium graminearum]|nr:hypothetical protein FG05_35351 [Fusarium graminearum]